MGLCSREAAGARSPSRALAAGAQTPPPLHGRSRLHALAAATPVGILAPWAADGRRLLVLLDARGRPFREPERGEKVTILCSGLFRIRQTFEGSTIEGFDIFRIRLM